MFTSSLLPVITKRFIILLPNVAISVRIVFKLRPSRASFKSDKTSCLYSQQRDARMEYDDSSRLLSSCCSTFTSSISIGIRTSLVAFVAVFLNCFKFEMTSASNDALSICLFIRKYPEEDYEAQINVH
ncbi:hypothetical protein HanPSC8_Chr17g0778561 [Helianthus annuus]|nr:hypothetical protein HanPSC8_Chr17g0778561 [Helianthus annuus]